MDEMGPVLEQTLIRGGMKPERKGESHSPGCTRITEGIHAQHGSGSDQMPSRVRESDIRPQDIEFHLHADGRRTIAKNIGTRDTHITSDSLGKLKTLLL